MFIFDDMFYDGLDEMLYLMSVVEDDEDTEYIDFNTMTNEEMEQFYK